jgi:four helix bundle protein
MSVEDRASPVGCAPNEPVTTKIRRFEDLVAWQKARTLTRLVYQITREPPLSSDLNLVEQMRDSAVSIMSNVAEGFERSSPGEFSRFLAIAKASCAELRSQLYAAVDAGYLSSQKFRHVLSKAEESARVLGGLRAAVLRRRDSSSGRS